MTTRHLACSCSILTLCLVLAACLNAFTRTRFSPSFPHLAGMRLSETDAVQTCTLTALGMRRLAADLSFIQLMMYYGEPEAGAAEEHEEHEHGSAHAHETLGSGHYPEVGPRTLRILALDPYFTYATLYAAGVLAFNLERPQEALQILDEALKWDPQQWKYSAYVAGIGFHKKGDPREVIELLTPVIADPDCPVLIKNLLAFLNRRLGRNQEAIRIYTDILKTRDPSYYKMALEALRELGAPIPRD